MFCFGSFEFEIVIVMKAAFGGDQIPTFSATRICSTTAAAPSITTRKLTCTLHAWSWTYTHCTVCTVCTPDSSPSGPESRLGHRHRHRIAIIRIHPATLFLPLQVQITNRKPRKETLGNLWIEYWGQFGGYALRRRASNTPRIIHVKTTKGKGDKFGDLHEAAVAPPGLRAAHLHLGHFHAPALRGLTVDCRLLPCCSGETTGAALPLAEQGALGSLVGSAGNCPRPPWHQPYLTYTSNKTYPESRHQHTS